MNKIDVRLRSIAVAAALFTLAFVGAASAQEIRWVGVYYCRQQGVTGLTLTITQLSGKQMRAVADIYPNPTNPDVPSGALEMSGASDAAGHAVNLKATRWLRQAPGYDMADFFGEVSANGQLLTGALYASGSPIPACTSALVRASQ
jgi:hypothetical protein